MSHPHVKSESAHSYLGLLSAVMVPGRCAVVSVPDANKEMSSSLAVRAVAGHLEKHAGKVGWAGLHVGDVRRRVLEVTEVVGRVSPGLGPQGSSPRCVMGVDVGATLSGMAFNGLVLDFTHTAVPADEASQQRVWDWASSTAFTRVLEGFILVLGTSSDTFLRRARRNVQVHGLSWDIIQLAA